ncbi:2'-5' RNA ligase family protein [Rhodonellum sp.]|uniref:2'-5' RNA ligase family protein n=1 Tax=Rhodonellum sp. TaxID=2231180 RepID=UPI00271B9864|nr:2'-5' RNA ligase family protein [Rhodonellum sp.]MDO9552464.1 2'-5' RNA ligase family protein [Rhodonellum sp.]
MTKYFVAYVPEGEIQEEATKLKLELYEAFNLKYALKSPSHVTLKMPFSWNEAKEEKLIQKIKEFFDGIQALPLTFQGFGKFGRRVIFVNVVGNPELSKMQREFSSYCKTALNQVEELSDKSFRPHMTLAYKDTKENRFEEYWDFISQKKFSKEVLVDKIALLRRVERKWQVIHFFVLK